MRWTFSASGVGMIATSTPSARNFVANNSASSRLFPGGLLVFTRMSSTKRSAAGFCLSCAGTMLARIAKTPATTADLNGIDAFIFPVLQCFSDRRQEFADKLAYLRDWPRCHSRNTSSPRRAEEQAIVTPCTAKLNCEAAIAGMTRRRRYQIACLCDSPAATLFDFLG